MKIKQKYLDRCSNYILWLCAPLYQVDNSLPDMVPEGVSAVEAMFMKETHGKDVICCEPRLLDAYKKGKASREFHVTGWLSMTRSGEAVPEEFFGCLGLRSSEEFQSVFGVSLTLPRLRIILRELDREIERLETICAG